jgi:predicted glycoside hydrolase/deacetylase ChbG (UPF0249 family)
MRLIVNADDFGYTPGVNYGVVDAHLRGAVTSATAMVNMPAFAQAMELARQVPTLGVGLHFNITAGRPVTGRISTLTDENGAFRGREYLFGAVEGPDPQDVEEELEAQLQAMLKSGCTPDHIDSHHHVHALPIVEPAVLRVAGRMDVPVRDAHALWDGAARGPVPLCTGFHAENARTDWLIGYLAGCGEDVLELMAHPGFADAALLESSRYAMQRVREHAVLTDPALKAFTERNGIRLVRFDEI